METWGIIGALEEELSLLTAAMENITTHTIAGRDYYEGTLEGHPVAVTKCGVGKVFSAMAAQTLIDRFAVTKLINIGVAGGVGVGLHVGDMVLSTDAVQHDFDVTALGYAVGHNMDVSSDPAKPTRYPADEELRERFKAAAQKTLPADCGLLEGTVASGDQFVDSAAKKEELRERFGAVACEMEGAAMAQVAYCQQVPFLIVRTLSDLADGEAPISFREMVQMAADRATTALLCMFRDLPAEEG